MNLELTHEERAYLLELLREERGRLRAEVYRTEAADFKDELKARERTLEGLIGRLEAGLEGSPVD